MAIDKIVGIIGWPVAHSISPIMQNRAFLEAGLDSWCYVPMPVSKYPYIRVKEAVLGLRALSCQGANVTVPYKEAVVQYLDKLSDSAKAISAVNTIVVDSEGRLVGHNTDGYGFITDLSDHGVNPIGMHVLVLGAGGSARAIMHALLTNGCRRITILNRTKTKADDVAYSFRAMFRDAMIDTGPLTKDAIKMTLHAELIVNATNIGMSGFDHQMPWDENIHFSSSHIVYDLIYNPAVTPLLAHAAKDNAKTINGLGMLVHQGAQAFELWTGQPAPIAAMRDAAERALTMMKPA